MADNKKSTTDKVNDTTRKTESDPARDAALETIRASQSDPTRPVKRRDVGVPTVLEGEKPEGEPQEDTTVNETSRAIRNTEADEEQVAEANEVKRK